MPQEGRTMSATRRAKEFLISSDAATATEYAITLSLVIVVGLVAFRSFGTDLRDVFSIVAGDTVTLHSLVPGGN